MVHGALFGAPQRFRRHPCQWGQEIWPFHLLEFIGIWDFAAVWWISMISFLDPTSRSVAAHVLRHQRWVEDADVGVHMRWHVQSVRFWSRKSKSGASQLQCWSCLEMEMDFVKSSHFNTAELLVMVHHFPYCGLTFLEQVVASKVVTGTSSGFGIIGYGGRCLRKGFPFSPYPVPAEILLLQLTCTTQGPTAHVPVGWCLGHICYHLPLMSVTPHQQLTVLRVDQERS